ncbi:gas vesicle protein GvpO [Streptomyces sp. 7N604]|uniref:gas vesicle protein GvpO n=1 Tax=Streptomyces sp. 7N604 TaxID=3457415 RepID=UPI003FD4D5E7
MPTAGRPDDARARASDRDPDRAGAKSANRSAKRSSDRRERATTREPDRSDRQSRQETAPAEGKRETRRRTPGLTAREAAAHAALHVQGFTGRQPEGVTSLEHDEGGWRVGIEVVETHRIPDSTDVLAEYQVEVDEEGELLSYHRDRRYYRSRPEESGS